jgi:hypothetical protein
LAVSISTGTCARRRRAGADAAADVQPVHVGQHQVEDDQVGRLFLQTGQAAQAVGGVGKGKARLDQVFTDHPGQAAVVFDHQQAGAHGRSVIRAGMVASCAAAAAQP